MAAAKFAVSIDTPFHFHYIIINTIPCLSQEDMNMPRYKACTELLQPHAIQPVTTAFTASHIQPHFFGTSRL
jgi:hypothetical protein